MSLIGLFGFDTLVHPWALVLLLGVALLFLAEAVAGPPGAMRISTGETLARLQRRRGTLLRRLPALLRAAGLALLVIALARPLKGLQPRMDSANVVDILLCVDVSGSMKAMDFVVQGQRRNRLDVTKIVVRDFIENRSMGRGQYGVDRLGLILYAGYAWTQCPLTLDYGILERELELAQIDELDPKSRSTAIGSAIGLAVSRLRKSEADSKVVVLLTDGRNNAGELDPITAAHLAKDYGIRVYTVGAGSRGEVPFPQQVLGRPTMQRAYLPVDDETLERIASLTGGHYYRATDTLSLQEAYDEIDQLETTEVEIGDYYEYEEGFVPYAMVGTLALMLSIFSRRVWFDAIP